MPTPGGGEAVAEEAAAVEEVTEAEAEEANTLCVSKLVLFPAPQSTAGRMRKRLTDNDMRATLNISESTVDKFCKKQQGKSIVKVGRGQYQKIMN